MKTVLCCINSKFVHSSLAPWCLRAGVGQYAPQLPLPEVFEGTINQEPETLCTELAALRPAVLGVCTYIWNICFLERLLPLFHTVCPDCRIVLGGPEVSYRAADVLNRYPYVTGVLGGEGEKPFALLLAALTENRPVAGLPGYSYRLPDGSAFEAEPYISDEEAPSPYCPEYFARLGGRIAYLETSRGCPFSCAFCLSGRCGSVRFFSLERAKRELLLLASSGARTIKLVDRTFNCQPQRCFDLLSFIIAHAGKEIPDGVCFHFEIGADLFDDRTLQLLKSAPVGLIQMEAGLQSFHQPTLEAVQRRTDMEKLCRHLRALIAMDTMHIHIDLIAGLPFESFACFADSFDKAFALRPHMLQLGFLKLLYGSALRRDAARYETEFSPAAPYEFIRGAWLSREDVSRIHRAEDALERLYNSGRFLITVDYLLAVTGLSPFYLFLACGEKMGDAACIHLAAYEERLYALCLTLPGVKKEVLRDVMALDVLASNKNGQLADCLRRPDDRLKALSRLFAATSPHQEKGIRRAVLILYSRNEETVGVEYVTPHLLSGRFPIVRTADRSPYRYPLEILSADTTEQP